MFNPIRRKLIKVVATLPAGAALLTGVQPAVAKKSLISDTQSTDKIACNPILSHQLRPLMEPDSRALCELYEGQVLLFVNTASKCGFTPQFESLEILHNRYFDQGFRVLGFPSDDFRQELSSEKAVAEFCELNYGVSFPMFQKIGVKGDSAHPLYRDLAAAAGTDPQWNFNKYLLDRQGRVVAHFSSATKPLGEQITESIEALL